VLRGIEHLQRNLSGEKNMKNLDQDHEVLIVLGRKESLEDDWGEKQQPVSQLNGYKRGVKRKKDLRSHIGPGRKGRRGPFQCCLSLMGRGRLFIVRGGFVWRRTRSISATRLPRYHGARE